MALYLNEFLGGKNHNIVNIWIESPWPFKQGHMVTIICFHTNLYKLDMIFLALIPPTPLKKRK